MFAHPDDDAFGVFGTILLHVEEGLEVMTILATRGEAGPIADPSLATRENLGEVREREAHAAYEALRVAGARLHLLGYPDGGVAEVPREEIVGRVAELLSQFGPDVVVTFGPDGVTKHDDHVAMSVIATEAFHRAREASEKGFFRLLYVGIPQSRIELYQEMQRDAGQEPFNPEDPFQPRGVPDETIAYWVDCTAVWKRKYEALLEHRTQREELEAFPEASLPVAFGEEHFVQAWPARDPGASRLTDVFQDLS